MASVQERLAESLKVLKDYQDHHENLIIKGSKILGPTHTTRLVKAGYLQTVIKGWYMPSFPGSEGDTTVWYASFWQFITAYANSRFGAEWCLTAEESLDFYAGESVIPSQLVIRAKKASNNIIQLKFGDSLLDISAVLPKNLMIEPRYGLHLYSLAEALIFCSPQYYKTAPLNARTCLASLQDANEIIKVVADEGNTIRTSRVCGALMNIGRDDMATEISTFMQRLGYDMRIDNPFKEPPSNIVLSTSPYAVRIRLMWGNMRTQILSLQLPNACLHADFDTVIKNMEANYVKDSYNSLSIEGYR
nr:cell filamentation protein Fic [Prevotella sp.]